MGLLGDVLFSWSRRHGLRPLVVGTACCAGELEAALGPRFGGPVRGCLSPTAVAAHADLLIVGGRVTGALAPLVREAYEAMAPPRWVVAFGACACSGGPFGTYATVLDLDRVVPVDVYVAGCPPRPEDLTCALAQLAGRRRRPGGAPPA